MAENYWSVDNDDKYGYKSLLMHLCSPDRFPEPDKAGIAADLQGHLNKIEWNDIYDLSKIRKQAKGKLGVDVDVAQLYSHLMEVFSPEKYKKVGVGAEQIEQYEEICKTLTAAKDDINLLESELYDIAKLDVDLWNEPEEDKIVSQPEVIMGEVVKEDSLSEDTEMLSGKRELINNILISLANSGKAKELTDDDVLIGEVFNAEDDSEYAQAENCPVKSKTETKAKAKAKAEIVAAVKTKPEPESQPNSNPKPKPESVKPPVPAHPAPKEQGMFSHPFSFNGRIRRAEYWLSLILAAIVVGVLVFVADDADGSGSLTFLIIIVSVVMAWFLLAQRAKRCHDFGASGWCQLFPLISPLFELWLLFANSEYGWNEYGDCPKKMRRNW